TRYRGRRAWEARFASGSALTARVPGTCRRRRLRTPQRGRCRTGRRRPWRRRGNPRGLRWGTCLKSVNAALARYNSGVSMADGRAHAFGRNVETREELCSEAFLVFDDREQEILGHDRPLHGEFMDPPKDCRALGAQADLLCERRVP